LHITISEFDAKRGQKLSIKEFGATQEAKNLSKFIKRTEYAGTTEGVEQAIKDSIMTNVRNKSIKDIEILDLGINGMIKKKDLSRALDFNTSKTKFFNNIVNTFRDNNLLDFWNAGVAPKLSRLKDADFGILQERLNFVERISNKMAGAIKKLPVEQAQVVKGEIAKKINELVTGFLLLLL